MKNDKIVILGALGMLGSALAAKFHSSTPTLLDKEELDITNEDRVSKVLQQLKPTAVLNAAAYTDVDGAEDNEVFARKINGDAIGILVRACAEVHAALVHYSTDYVFDGRQDQGYLEDDIPNPINAYGRTKLAGERELQKAKGEWLLIRTSWLYGPGGKNFVTTILGLAQKKPTLSIVHDQVGSPTYTRDLATRTHELLAVKARGIHHATNSGTTSWYNFARAILDEREIATPVVPITTSQLSRKAQRPAYSVLRNTKDQTMRPWPEALHSHLANDQTKEGEELPPG